MWHPSQILRNRRDGSLEMRIGTSGHKELVRWVLSWVPDVEVLSSAENVAAFCRKTQSQCLIRWPLYAPLVRQQKKHH